MTRRHSPSRRRWPWALALAALATGAFVYRGAEPPTPELPTTRVERRPLERTITATGVIRPVVGAEVDVGSRLSGRVARLAVQVGDEVRTGDLLAELDTAELDAALAAATAELALRRAELAQTSGELERQRRLADEGILALRELEQGQRDFEVTRARVDSASARVDSARINLGYARIEAPIRGVVAEVTTREGETVAASLAAPTFVTIIDLDRLEVQAYVDETDIGRVFVGQRGTFTVDTYPQLELAATVTALRPAATLRNGVVNYVVLLRFETPPDAVLRPEMTAHVRLLVERRDGVLTVPRAALRRHDGGRYVLLRQAEGWLERPVRTGEGTGDAVEVLAGLAEGDEVALNPL